MEKLSKLEEAMAKKLDVNPGKSLYDPDWRSKELNLDEVIKKYPGFPPLVILKADLQRRGVKVTGRAAAHIDPEKIAVNSRSNNFENEGYIPNGLLLRDGSSVITYLSSDAPEPFTRFRDPYYVDFIDGRPVITDNGRVIEEAAYWPKPDYYDKKTTKGTPMWHVLSARPQRLEINTYQNCDFWKLPGLACKYCYTGFLYNLMKDQKPEIIDFEDAAEAVGEALKQPGRWRSIQFCGGSRLDGDEALDAEVDLYIDILKRIEKYLPDRRAMVQMVATAFNPRQLRRLRDETILTGYTSDIEVLDKDVFNAICPGKAKYIGYDEWKNRLYHAVDIFGAGRITTGIVSGVELAQPFGFANEEEALEKSLAEAEDLARHGVGVCQTVYNNMAPGSMLYRQKNQPLEYNIAFAEGLDKLSRKHNIDFTFDDYRTCGNHPNTDLARI
jgi:hypothetical protein